MPVLDKTSLWWCVTGMVLALAPHAARFSPGVLACFGALAAWRLLGAYDKLPLPDRAHLVLWWLKQLLAIVAFVAIYVSYRGQIGRDAGVALLTALLGLKLLELDNERDFYLVTFLTYFLVVTNFFYSQSVPTALYMLGIVIVVTASLIRFNTPHPIVSTAFCLKLAARMVLQATPVMVLAFLLFPRLPGPLWGLPQDAYGAVTGLSDSMSIGHITALGTSDEIAFRAKFDGNVPRAADLYWRGPVLWETDGRTWRGGNAGMGEFHPVVARGPIYRYEVLLEPTGERWILGLDAVTHSGREAVTRADYSLYARAPIKKRLRYRLESTTRFMLNSITPAERQAALRLPNNAHPQARALAQAWLRTASKPEDIVKQALNHFRTQGFVYTLLPPALPGDAIDQFLFDSKAGFCEHYAASFVVLMRAAGIPARVVTGYQGGEFNDISDYLIVRQRDAHAWAEVFLDNAGWVRVDPTSAVAPARLSLGIESWSPRRSPILGLARDSAAVFAMQRVAALWDAMNYEWSQWVLGYSPQRQFDFLASLGLDELDEGDMMMLLTGTVAGLMLLVGLATLRARSMPSDPLVRWYARYCASLARISLPRAAHEGPLDYAARVAATRPDLASEVEHITKLYTALRYTDTRIDPELLKKAVRNFAPHRAVRVAD